MRQSQWCYVHNPDLEEERASNNRRGGKRGSRGRDRSAATRELHTLLEDLTERVVGGELDTARGNVAAQLINTRIRLLGHELKVREVEELERRLEELESYLEQNRSGYYG